MLGTMTVAGCGSINQTFPPIISSSSTPAATAEPGLTTVATTAARQETLSPDSPRPASLGDAVPLGMPFPIQIGQTVEIASEDIAITFRQVTEDSRCPVDVECFWAGQAVIDVEVARQGSSLGSFSLTLGQDEQAAQARVSSYTITFVELDPIPDTRIPSPPDYVATLSVVLDD